MRIRNRESKGVHLKHCSLLIKKVNKQAIRSNRDGLKIVQSNCMVKARKRFDDLHFVYEFNFDFRAFGIMLTDFGCVFDFLLVVFAYDLALRFNFDLVIILTLVLTMT